MRSAVLIYNPHAGRPRDRRHAASRMVDALRRRGVHVEARATAAAGDAERLSRDALAAGVETVIVHGGDGTVNEALQPLVGGTTALASGQAAPRMSWRRNWGCRVRSNRSRT